MALRNVWHWFNSKGGPKEAALVLTDGSLVPYRYDDWAGRQVVTTNLANAIAFCVLVPATGEWSAEGNHPVHGGTLCAKGATAEEAAAAWVTKRDEVVAEEARITADPVAHLERELARVDWYSHMSDDFRVWSAGEAHWKLIESLRAKVGEEKFNELVAKYQPK